MPERDPPCGEPSTEHEFREHLIALIRTAHENGVDVDGGWMDRNERTDVPDRGIEIYRVVDPVDDPA